MNRYQNNAFRVLGLLPTASMAEIMSRVNEIKVKQSLGVNVTFEYDFPWMGPIDRSEENVISALQRLVDPVLRFKEKIFCFWIIKDIDKQALHLLSQNKRKDAYQIWGSEIKSQDAASYNDTILAYLNQAVLVHSSVIGEEMFVKYDVDALVENKVSINQSRNLVCPKCQARYEEQYKYCFDCGAALTIAPIEKTIKSKKRLTELDEMHWKNWQFIWKRFLFISSQEPFWEVLNKTAEEINDPRLNETKISEIRDNFISNILEPNFIFISQALSAKDFERVKKHSNLINGINLPPGVLKRELNKLLNYHITSLDVLSKKTNENVEMENDKNNLINLYSKLYNQTQNYIYEVSLVDINGASDFVLTRDNVSKTLRDISIKIHNKFEDYEKAFEVIECAIEVAGTSYQKQNLERDEKVCKEHFDSWRKNNPAPASVQGAEDSRVTTSASRSEGSRSATTSKAQSRPIPKTVPSSQSQKKSNVWGWLVWIVIFIIIRSLNSNHTSSAPSSSSAETFVHDGLYHCSDYDHNQAELLKPAESEGKSIESDRTALNSHSEELDSLMTEINGMGVTSDSPQYLIDSYNAKIDGYNAKKTSYRSDLQEFNNRVDAFNVSNNTYNKYLETHCRK